MFMVTSNYENITIDVIFSKKPQIASDKTSWIGEFLDS